MVQEVQELQESLEAGTWALAPFLELGSQLVTIPHSPKNIVLLDFTLTYENYMRRCQYRLPDHLAPMPQHIDW